MVEHAKSLMRIVALNTSMSLIPPVLVYVFSPDVSLRRLLWTFAVSLVYSTTIGSMAQTVMPRIWNLLSPGSEWVQIAFRGIALLAIAVGGCLLGGIVIVLFGWQPWSEFWEQFAGSVKLAILITVLAGGVLAVNEATRQKLQSTTLELRTRELERERAVKLAAEARLASLESRIHPHFLFNALNSISSLIPEDPERAERLIGEMADLLRFSLDSPTVGLVPLEREMKIVAGYLAIEKARFGERLQYSFDVPEALALASVPPLALQTLVENSVKFAVSKSRSGGEIRICASCEGGLLRVGVRDNGPGFSLDSAPAGHGIDNLQSRLSSLFGTRAELTVEREAGWSVVTVSVPV